MMGNGGVKYTFKCKYERQRVDKCGACFPHQDAVDLILEGLHEACGKGKAGPTPASGGLLSCRRSGVLVEPQAPRRELRSKVLCEQCDENKKSCA